MHQTGVKVAIVDDVLAKKLWPDGDALGQQIQFAAKDAARANSGGRGGVGSFAEPAAETKMQIEIVGIVPRTRQSLFEKDPSGALYLPFAGGFQSNVFFHIKFAPNAGRDSIAATELIRRTVRDVDSAIPILELKSFAQHLDSNLQLWIVRAGAALFSIFGGLALALAVVGLYGVKAYSVARRTREIGIRMALGAQAAAVLRLVVWQGLKFALVGLVVGAVGAFALKRFIESQLYGVGAADPLTFAFVAATLVGAAALACLVPARRATKVDPVVALRNE